MLEFSDNARQWQSRVKAFMDEHIYPNEATYSEQLNTGDRWQPVQIVEDLKEKAKEAGLWNMFLPASQNGAGLNNLEYAPLSEELGKVGFASETMNCSAPDTGNMEVLERYGSDRHKEQYLKPLLAGEIRSVFLMTEPEVASSDATNIECRIERDGDEYVLNGRKWWSSGAPDPRCKVGILMGKTDPTADRHKQQSMIVVPMDAPGLTVERHLTVFGYDDAPHGHGEIQLDNVRVPAENLLLGEGRGFEIAQGRLGPGRIHHCMRSVGVAERALALMVDRANSRVAFGKKLADMGSVREDIAKSRIEIDQARLHTLWAAHRMDTVGNKEARTEIASIKVSVPNMTLRVIDRAIQVHGGMGVSQDTFLAKSYAGTRTLRLADGPDQVHMEAIAKWELRKGAKLAAGEEIPGRGL
ncbi:MAG: acyl-CoA dehydrogenase [Chloroflexi bacterium]|nr:MAG: acyl-CoA dehydrogenase [Chloroflexota bacterium]